MKWETPCSYVIDRQIVRNDIKVKLIIDDKEIRHHVVWRRTTCDEIILDSWNWRLLFAPPEWGFYIYNNEKDKTN